MTEPWTPGPWRTGASDRDVYAGAEVVAFVNAPDARLIAAAPEMVDTIADLIDQLRWADEQLGQGQSCGAMADDADALLKRIRNGPA